jgi:RNA polymerase sigma-70 factor (ECF subfamily)
MAPAGEPTEDRSDRLQLFDRLYATHATALHDYLLGRTSDAEVARDLLQETCVRLWRRIAEVGELAPDRQRAWLFTVARNLVVDLYRSRASAEAANAALGQRAIAAGAGAVAAAETDAMAREDRDLLDAAIARLPQALRTVLVLQVLGDRTSAEIGELLGRPAGTVRYQIAQARRQLAAELGLLHSAQREVTS